jgi:endonuclease III
MRPSFLPALARDIPLRILHKSSIMFREEPVKHGAIALVFLLMAVSLSGTPRDQQTNKIWLYLFATETEEAKEIRTIVIQELTREIEKRGLMNDSKN